MHRLLIGLMVLAGLMVVSQTPAEARARCYINHYGHRVCHYYRSHYYGRYYGNYESPWVAPGVRIAPCAPGYTWNRGACRPYRGY